MVSRMLYPPEYQNAKLTKKGWTTDPTLFLKCHFM